MQPPCPLRRLAHRFETLIAPTGPVPHATPPDGTVAFFWYFARQARGVLAALLVAGLFTAGFDLLIPVCIGRIAGLVATIIRARRCCATTGGQLAGDGRVDPDRAAGGAGERVPDHQPGDQCRRFANRVRWQSHWHVIRQSWTFFQNDFAGRIANG